MLLLVGRLALFRESRRRTGVKQTLRNAWYRNAFDIWASSSMNVPIPRENPDSTKPGAFDNELS